MDNVIPPPLTKLSYLKIVEKYDQHERVNSLRERLVKHSSRTFKQLFLQIPDDNKLPDKSFFLDGTLEDLLQMAEEYEAEQVFINCEQFIAKKLDRQRLEFVLSVLSVGMCLYTYILFFLHCKLLTALEILEKAISVPKSF